MRKIVASIALGAALFVACAEELPPPVPCRNIPEGGCPRRDNACVDPTCSAVYVCKADGNWRLDRTCPPRATDAGPDTSAAPIDAGNVQDARIDANVPGASGGPGCESLVVPDCALATAAACGADCCGCEDVFVCSNGGWDLYGRCQNGALIEEPAR